MTRLNTKKEKSEKTPSSSNGKAKQRNKVARADGQLEDQVTLLGGDSLDMELLKDVDGSSPLEVGAQEHDPVLSNDVSKFLQRLKSSKHQTDESVKTSKKAKPEIQDMKQKKQKSEAKAASNAKSEVPDVKLPILPPTTPPKGSKLVFPPSPQWYSSLSLPSASETALPSPTAAQLSSLTERAANLLRRDAELYQSSAASTGHSSSDSHFLNTILTQGTLSDRLSALTLLVQGSPVHNTKALEALKGMAERGRGKGGREEALKAMRCIVDWWVGGGAPSRKLRYLRDQPFLLHPDATDGHLVMWHFEDWLKKFFYSILQILEIYSLDPLAYVRTQALSFITTLLRDKPEQEQNLLRLLVNKMGDTEKAVCSRASYHILQVLQAHPAMKAVIVREVRSLIFRPTASTSTSIQEAATKAKAATHIRFTDHDGDDDKGKPKKKTDKTNAPAMDRWNSHSWYYSAVTLNQVVLTPSEQDRDTARLLIEVYFEMFREILGSTSGEEVEKVVDEDEDEKAKTDGRKRGADKRKSRGKEKAVQGAAGFSEVEDANSRLVSGILTGVNRALPFAKVDSDGGSEMFRKHIDTLFLITHTSTFNISLQALMLILQVITTFTEHAPSSSKPDGNAFSATLSDRFYRTLYVSLLDPRLSKSNKQAMYLNLLFKAVKVDQNLERVKAFVRRFVQILTAGVGGSGGPEFIAGGLYLLGELFSTVSGLREMLNSTPVSKQDDESQSYDPRKRDPQYAHASASPLYELLPLIHHYHPSVSLHARQLLTSIPLTASADLSLNTLSHFLDRFIYKNPKKPKVKGASAMQPAASTGDGASGVKLVKGEVAGQGGPVNEEMWWKRRVEDVPADEVFFHKYFRRKHSEEQRKKAKVEKRKGPESGDENEDEDGSGDDSSGQDEEEEEAEGGESDEDSDKEEAEIWKAMKATMPTELQDDDPMDDSDDILSGMDDESGADVPSDEEDAEANIEGDPESDADDDSGNDEEEGVEDEDDALSLVEGSDAEDLIPLDADIPNGLMDYEGSDAGDEDRVPADESEWTGFGDAALWSKKRKRAGDEGKGDSEGKNGRRKKLRSLPTFASYEDYAKLIEDGPEDNI